MNKKRDIVFNSKTAFVLSITIGIIIMIVMLISYFHARVRISGQGLSVSNLLTWSSGIILVLNVLLLYFLFCFQFRIITSHITKKRKPLTIVFGSLILTFIISPVFSNIHWWLFVEHIPASVFLSIFFVKDLILAVISLLFTALMYAWVQREQAILENKELMVENIQNRYDALKNQVDPHFLFNSLNTLKGLIGYDDDKAQDYIDQLSLVFRYTIQNKPVMQLAGEVEFAESYSYLMKIRYGESLHMEYNIDNKYLDYYILPCGLQLLVENAVKHNVISNKYPLTITIETTGNDTIKVKNNLQPKAERKHGGVGLTNLNERYQLMFGKEVLISQSDNCFTVEIPLIKEIKNKNISTEDYEGSNCRRRIGSSTKFTTAD